MNKQEKEGTQSKIVAELGGVRIEATGGKYNLVNSDTGNCIIRKFNTYKQIGENYIELVKYGKTKHDVILQVIYSIKQNKIWDIPRKPRIEQCNGMTLFINGMLDTTYDVAVFLDKTGDFVDRLKVPRPTNDSKKTVVCSRINKHKVLEFKVGYIGHWKEVYRYQARIIFRPEIKIGKFKISLKEDNKQHQDKVWEAFMGLRKHP